MILTYKHRLLPTKAQHKVLTKILEDQRILYNAALEERIDCHRKTGKSLNFFDQGKALTKCRKQLTEMQKIPRVIQIWTLLRLDIAFKGFFRRLKLEGKVGFPRFRGKGRWNSFGFADTDGIRFDGKRLRWKNLPGGLRVYLHRPLPKNLDIRSGCFTKDIKGWYICFHVGIPDSDKVTVNKAIGIDLGLKVFAYQSDGVIISNPRIAKRVERELRRRQRALSRCKKGSNRRKKVRANFAVLHKKIANTRSTWLHQQSARIVNSYDLIAVEDLNIKSMVKNPKYSSSILDASWSKFLGNLAYKAEKAGKYLIKVNPRGTSQKCSGCGEPVPKSLWVRTHSCPHCGLVLDRDLNASRNILMAVVGHGEHNVIQWDKRALRNISLVTN